MLSLHAGFSANRLLVWCESAQPQGAKPLADLLKSLGIHVDRQGFQTAPVWLPSGRKGPVPSNALIAEASETKNIRIARSTVETAALFTPAMLDLLCHCARKDLVAPGVIVGPDLAYWTAAMEFAGALVARQQFLPDLVRAYGATREYRAQWRAACTGRDDDRLHALVAAMPPAARAFAPEIPAARLLGGFLDSVVDCLIRGTAPYRSGSGTLHDRWLAALQSPFGLLTGTEAELEQLSRQLTDWRRPISVISSAPFRLCFRLEEPAFEGAGSWQVNYLLQARNDPSLLIPAGSVWQAKGAKSPVFRYPGFQPREHMLFSLGQAAAAHLRGPVTKLTPHVLRHACASRLYGEGIGLAAIQQLLGHRWLSTTVRYVHVADEAIEHAYQQAAERAAARFKE